MLVLEAYGLMAIKKNKITGKKEEYIKEQFKKYVYSDFKRILK